METLVIVDQHRNRYYARRGKMMDGSGGPSRGFREINCRTFESGVGLLPSPVKGYGSPVSNSVFSSPRARDLDGVTSSVKMMSDDVKILKRDVKSSPININLKGSGKKERKLRDGVSLSELWAGPAYSNSPPPSSLPIPKFFLKPKRTVSLELPVLESDLCLEVMAKSAPCSPTKEFVGSSGSFFRDDDFATKTLRRMLNLDIADD